MADLDKAMVAPSKPATDAPKPDAAPPKADAAPAKVDPTPATPAPDNGDPDWSKAPPKWYKIYEGHKAKTAEKERELQAKIKSLEAKPFESAGDTAKLAALEKQLNDLRGETTTYKQELAKLDYTKSDEYKRDYVSKANAIYTEATSYVQRLQVTTADGSRPATAADFDYIRSLPLDARRRAANEMFGDNASDVLDFTRDIDKVRRDADMAVARHAETHEKTAMEREHGAKQAKEAYDGHFKTSLEAIQANPKYGKWFSENPDDPEASNLLRSGFDEIETITKTMGNMPLDQQAAYSAVLRARAAAMPRMMLEYNRVAQERDALKEELEKYRGTDPGTKPKGGEAPKSEAPKGIAGVAAMFDQM